MVPVRKCGSQGFECAAQGLGCMGMSAFYGGFQSDEAKEESLRVLAKAGEIPGMMLDTSDIYGPFTNEQLIAEAIKGERGNLKIATKCGICLSPEGQISLDSTGDYVKKSCQASLERLGIDCIDLYYLHRYNPETPIEDTMRGFKELLDEGKIKYVGVSEMGVESLKKAHAICPISAYQMEWSLFTRDVEEGLVPTCRDLGIGIVAYSPLGRGFLTGAIKSVDDLPEDDYRRSLPRMTEYFDDNLKLVDAVKEVAEEQGCTSGQVALAWVHAQGDDVFPIPGTKRLARFEENLSAVDVKLSEAQMTKLNELGDKIKGTRYNEMGMMATFGAQS